MEDSGMKVAFGTIAVGVALLLLSNLDSKTELFSTPTATIVRPTAISALPVHRGHAFATKLTSVQEPAKLEPSSVVLMGVAEPTKESGATEEGSSSIDRKSGLFNFISVAFFATLFHFRRKAALAQGYLPVEQAPAVSIAAASGSAASADESPKSGLAKLWSFLTSVDYSLFLCLTFWYVGNYYYNITNKFALKATGGVAGAPLTVASLQLLVGVLYGLFLWVAPDARKFPAISLSDVKNMVPLSIAFAGAHFSTVFSMSAGAVSFGQIVKASEPAFAALLGVSLYSQKVSTAKWLSLIPVIGGVCLASVAELDFSVAALIAGILANLFAAVKGNENKKAMDTPGLKDRLGNIGNQFAVTMTLAWALSLPLVLLAEWKQLPALVQAWTSNPVVSFNTISAGLWFYLYNELATIVVKKTGAVTQSVANTAKRVIVIVACGLVLGESLDTLKLVGCAIGILGVFLYSIIDDLVKSKPKPAA
eukprot:EG_transcript_8312